MKGKTILYAILATLLLVGITTAYTLVVGSYEKEIDQDLADSITTDVAAKGITLEQEIADFYVDAKEQELNNNLVAEAQDKVYQVIYSEDTKKIEALIDYLDNGCAVK